MPIHPATGRRSSRQFELLGEEIARSVCSDVIGPRHMCPDLRRCAATSVDRVPHPFSLYLGCPTSPFYQHGHRLRFHVGATGRLFFRPTNPDRLCGYTETRPASTMHPYGPASVQGVGSRVPSGAASRPPAAPVPMNHMTDHGSTLAPLYPGVRGRSPGPPAPLADAPKLSPRHSSGMVSAPDAPNLAPGPEMPSSVHRLSAANEQTWIAIGSTAEAMEDFGRALSAYDSALYHNPYSIPALSAMASMYRTLDHFEAVGLAAYARNKY